MIVKNKKYRLSGKNRKIPQIIFILGIFIIIFFGTFSFLSNSPVNYQSIANIPSSSSPILSFNNIIEINDDSTGDSTGDNDGIIDAGETIEMRFSLNNDGELEATNVAAKISTSNNYVNMEVDTSNFITIAAGSSGLASTYYVFTINSSCSTPTEIPFNITITASEGTWESTFSITVVSQPMPEFASFTLISENNGDLIADNDGIIDAGEWIDFKITIQNKGNAALPDGLGFLTEDDPFVELDDSEGNFGTIDSNNASKDGIFGMIVSGACPDKHLFHFQLTLTDLLNTNWILDIELMVNGSADYELLDFIVVESSGDDDGIIDAGEKWDIGIKLKNIGTAMGSDLKICPQSNDINLEFRYSESYRNRTLNQLNMGEEALYECSSYYYYWQFTISDQTPANHSLQFYIEVLDTLTDQKWTFYTNIQCIGKSNYELINITFIESTGNGDTIFNAGEFWYASISIRNSGTAIGNSLRILITSSDPYIDFNYVENSRNISFGALNPEQEYSFTSQSYWKFEISEQIPRNHQITFTFSVTDASEHASWDFNSDPINVITNGISGNMSTTSTIIIVIILFFGFVFGINFYAQNKTKIRRHFRSSKNRRYNDYKTKKSIKSTNSSSLLKKENLTKNDSNRPLLSQQEKNQLNVRFKNLKRYISNDSSKIIENINHLHELALETIDKDYFELADQILGDEIQKYQNVLIRLKTLGIASILDETTQQSQNTVKLQYKVRDTLYIQSYQSLFKQIEYDKLKNNYLEMDKKLKTMRDLTHNRHKIAEKINNSEDKLKYFDLWKDLEEKIRFNSFFLRFKEFETKYNQIITYANQHQFELGIKEAEKLIQEFNGFYRDIEGSITTNLDLKNLFDETHKLSATMLELRKKLEISFLQLIKNRTSDIQAFETFTGTIKSPQLVAIELDESIQEYMLRLDQQFDDWKTKEQAKIGKI